MKLIKILTVIILIAWIIMAAFNLRTRYPLTTMPGYQVLFFSLSISFLWVEIVLHGAKGYKKPLSCVGCLTGWLAFILAYIFHVQHWYFYLPAGLFTGAIYEAIKLRWL